MMTWSRILYLAPVEMQNLSRRREAGGGREEGIFNCNTL